MTFSRKDNNTGKIAYFLLILLGIGMIYACYQYASWIWNVLGIPTGILLAYIGYKQVKKSRWIISKLDLSEDQLSISYLNGQVKEIPKEKVVYSILVKKFILPVRALELREKGKTIISRGTTIGVLNISKWPDLEAIAKTLIVEDYERKPWRFGWTIGEFLMLSAMLLGMTEQVAENYVGEIQSSAPYDMHNLGEQIDDEAQRKRASHRQSEESFVERNEKSSGG